MRIIGLDIHRAFAEAVAWDADKGRAPMTSKAAEKMQNDTIGVDVSKDRLGAYRLSDGVSRRFANDKSGHKAFVKWLKETPAERVVFEPTGPYRRPKLTPQFSICSSACFGMNQGAHGVGEALAAALKDKGWTDGSVGLITISQARKNGQARTAGFRDAMKAAGLTKEAGLQQMQSYTADETFKFTQDMLTANPNMKAMFIQTDQPTLGALRAIKAGHRDGTLLVAAFDGIPEFVDLLKKGDIVASGMQQPYLMGVKSGEALAAALKGETPEKQILVPIVVATSKNIDQILPTIKETVFANEIQ